MPTRLTKTRKQYVPIPFEPALHISRLPLSQICSLLTSPLTPQSRPRIRRPRPCRQAPQASRWSWYGWWSTSPPNESRQIPPGLLREGRHAVFPQAAEPVLETGDQSGEGASSFSAPTVGGNRGGEWDDIVGRDLFDGACGCLLTVSGGVSSGRSFRSRNATNTWPRRRPTLSPFLISYR